jgi:hypothetical protein
MEVTAQCIGLLSGLYRVQNLSFIFAAERGRRGRELKTLKLQLNASARTRRVTGTDRKRKYRKWHQRCKWNRRKYSTKDILYINWKRGIYCMKIYIGSINEKIKMSRIR